MDLRICLNLLDHLQSLSLFQHGERVPLLHESFGAAQEVQRHRPARGQGHARLRIRSGQRGR